MELDCDVSEKTFSAKHGLALIPEDENIVNVTKIDSEKEITQAYRQQ